MPTLNELVQSLNMGDLVELYHLDLNPIGFAIDLYFTPSDQLGGNIVFGGITYLSRAVTMDGFEMNSGAAPPEPTLSIGNVDKYANALAAQYEDLIGARITKITTLSSFLDFLSDGVTVNPNADPTAIFLPEIWYVEQKETATRASITWRLRSVLDLTGKKIPNRLTIKNVCRRVYRIWNGSSFTYPTKNACPYAGGPMFKRDGSSTSDPTLDDCSKDIAACKLRFGDDPLPGWFFPGIIRIPKL